MGNNWPTVTIEAIQANKKGAIAIGPFGSRLKSDNYVEVGIPVIRGTNLTGGKKLTGDFVFITEEKADSLGSSNVYQNDLVFPHRGSIGEVGIILDNERYVLSSSLMKLSVDIDKVNPLYLYYFFRSSVGRYELLKNASQVGTPGIGQPLSSLKSIAFKKPPLDVQNKIAKILSELDNKLTLNRQINHTLEQMAQALFKSWFVDFDPVVDNALDAGFFEQDLAFPDELLSRAEARRAVREHGDFKPRPDAIRQLFPAAFEECAEPSVGLGGWVPQGWMTVPLTTISNIVYGKNLPKSQITNEGYPVYGGNGVIGSYSKYLYKDPQVLISCRGAASGKVHWTKPFCFVTNNSLVIEERNINSLYIYYCLLQQDLTNLTSGSAQPQMTIANLNPVNVLLPENELISTFVRHAQDLQTNCEARKIESETLSNLRDTLLPKLISGELRLDNIAADLAKEGVA